MVKVCKPACAAPKIPVPLVLLVPLRKIAGWSPACAPLSRRSAQREGGSAISSFISHLSSFIFSSLAYKNPRRAFAVGVVCHAPVFLFKPRFFRGTNGYLSANALPRPITDNHLREFCKLQRAAHLAHLAPPRQRTKKPTRFHGRGGVLRRVFRFKPRFSRGTHAANHRVRLSATLEPLNPLTYYIIPQTDAFANGFFDKSFVFSDRRPVTSP